jgi:hypothetical protein
MASAALNWALNNGMSQEQYYKNIFDYVNQNRGASDIQLRAEMDKYGVSPEDVASATGVPLAGVQARFNVAQNTTMPVAAPIPQNITAGQMRDLFPSFEESRRLAGQMVANRPTTEQVVNMISNPQNPALISAWQNAEQSGNYGDVAGMIQNMPLNKLQSAYGLSNADMQYIVSRPDIATALSKSNANTNAAPSLSNVLSMISK